MTEKSCHWLKVCIRFAIPDSQFAAAVEIKSSCAFGQSQDSCKNIAELFVATNITNLKFSDFLLTMCITYEFLGYEFDTGKNNGCSCVQRRTERSANKTKPEMSGYEECASLVGTNASGSILALCHF